METANIKNLSDMAKFFQSKLSALPTTDYLDKRLSRIEDRAEKTSEGLRLLEERVEKIERNGRPVVSERQSTRKTNEHLSVQREEAFLKAIRSLRIWPIQGNDRPTMSQSVDSFLKGALCMEQRDLDQVIVEDIQRVRSAPRARQHDEVCVVLRDPETRELILSYARNLSTYVEENGNPTAGI